MLYAGILVAMASGHYQNSKENEATWQVKTDLLKLTEKPIFNQL